MGLYSAHYCIRDIQIISLDHVIYTRKKLKKKKKKKNLFIILPGEPLKVPWKTITDSLKFSRTFLGCSEETFLIEPSKKFKEIWKINKVCFWTKNGSLSCLGNFFGSLEKLLGFFWEDNFFFLECNNLLFSASGGLLEVSDIDDIGLLYMRADILLSA